MHLLNTITLLILIIIIIINILIVNIIIPIIVIIIIIITIIMRHPTPGSLSSAKALESGIGGDCGRIQVPSPVEYPQEFCIPRNVITTIVSSTITITVTSTVTDAQWQETLLLPTACPFRDHTATHRD